VNFIQQIALSLADELRRRYPLDEIQAVPSFHYDLQDKTKTGSGIVPKHYSLTAIRGKKCLFSITVGSEEMSVSIHADKPDLMEFKEIEGLPEVALSVMLSKESSIKRFILAEPTCIEKLLSEIETFYPID